jgi:acetyltransferase-like isoleucine patch superfamily enzyme
MRVESVEIQKELFSEKKSALAKYRDLIVGRPGWGALIQYELINLLSYLPGAAGLLLRSKLYPLLLGKCGRGVVFGCGVVLRHPHKIVVGDQVVIDDHCVLDAKGQTNQGIVLGQGVFIGRNTILSCKNGDIILHDGANLGFNCEIFSGGARVEVGKNVMLAAYSYLIGGGHEASSTDVSPLEQARTATGITVGDGAWIGAGVLVLDGVNLGQQAIVGAGAVVTKPVDDFAVVAGVPARFVRSRK